MNSIGNKIKGIRLEFGLSQKEFAEKLGITQAAVSAIESGVRNPSTRALKKVSEIFDVDIVWLAELDTKHVSNKSNASKSDYANIVRFLSNEENASIDISKYMQQLYELSIKETHFFLNNRILNEDEFTNCILAEIKNIKKMYSIGLDILDKALLNKISTHLNKKPYQKEHSNADKESIAKALAELNPLLFNDTFAFFLLKRGKFKFINEKEKQMVEKQMLEIFHHKINNDDMIITLIRHNIVKPSELMSMQSAIEDNLMHQYHQQIRRMKF